MLAYVTIIFLTACFPEFGLANFVSPNSRTVSEKSESTVLLTWLYQGDKSDIQQADIAVILDGHPLELKYRFNFLGTHSSFGPHQYFQRVNFSATLSSNELKIDVVIQNVSVQDTGLYRCSVSFLSSPDIKTQDIQLIVIEAPTKPAVSCVGGTDPKNEGDNLNCSCSVTGGSPKPSLHWLPSRGQRDSSTLIIDPLSRTDSGNYTCVAKNIGGEENTQLNLVVHYLDLDCSVEIKEKVPYLLVEKKGHPSPCESTCKKQTIKLAPNVSHTVSANNTFIERTCNVSVVHGINVTTICSPKSVEKFILSSLSYFFVNKSNGDSQVTLFSVDPDVHIENSTGFNLDHENKIANDSENFKSLVKNLSKLCKLVLNETSSNNVDFIVGLVVGVSVIVCGLYSVSS